MKREPAGGIVREGDRMHDAMQRRSGPAHVMAQPVDLPVNEKINLETTKGVKVWGGLVVLMTLVLYAIFL